MVIPQDGHCVAEADLRELDCFRGFFAAVVKRLFGGGGDPGKFGCLGRATLVDNAATQVKTRFEARDLRGDFGCSSAVSCFDGFDAGLQRRCLDKEPLVE
jgi:hypothetical protein